MNRIRLIIVLTGFLLSDCAKKVIPETQIHGLDYFPLSEGKFSVFACDSIVYREIPRDTLHFRFFLKEVFVTTFIDNEQNTAWIVERYVQPYRPDLVPDSSLWKVREAVMVNADNRMVRLQENNTRFTKLIFPVRENATWDGNAQNSLGKQNYTYEYLDRTETIASTNFGKVLSVSQMNFQTLISSQSAIEKYAAGYGLVYRRTSNVFSNNVVPGKPVMDRIENGIDYQQTLIKFGHE